MSRPRPFTLAAGLLALAACAEPHPEPEPTTLTVRALDRMGAPVAGVEVMGNDAAGARVDQAVTGVDGRATLSVPAGGSVTAHDADPAVPAELVQHQWYTVLAVEPGDELHVPIARGPEPRRAMPVSAPPLPPRASRFSATGPCAESNAAAGGEAATLWLDRRCPAHGPMVLSAMAPGPDAASVVAYVEAADVDLSGTEVAVTGAWAAPTHTFTVELAGLPADGGQVSVARGALVDGYPVHWVDLPVVATGPTGTASASRPSIGDGVVHRLAVAGGDFCRSQGRGYTRARVADVDRFAFDLGDLLPPITDVTVGERALSWTGGAAATVSGLSVRLDAARGSGDVVGQGRSWTVVAPPGASTVALPDVGFEWPAGPGQGDRVTALHVSEVASSRWSSYAELRQRAADDPPRIDGDFETRTTSFTGQYAYLGCPFEP